MGIHRVTFSLSAGVLSVASTARTAPSCQTALCSGLNIAVICTALLDRTFPACRTMLSLDGCRPAFPVRYRSASAPCIGATASVAVLTTKRISAIVHSIRCTSCIMPFVSLYSSIPIAGSSITGHRPPCGYVMVLAIVCLAALLRTSTCQSAADSLTHNQRTLRTAHNFKHDLGSLQLKIRRTQ